MMPQCAPLRAASSSFLGAATARLSTVAVASQDSNPTSKQPRCDIPLVQDRAAGAAESTSFVHQRSVEWHELRQHRLTASTFSVALGFWGMNRRLELWEEKVGLREAINTQNRAMEWGSGKESVAVQQYQQETGNVVQGLGFKIYKEGDDVLGWLGASPDGLIEKGKSQLYEKSGVLEVKCPHNKGFPELSTPWAKVPYHYMPQLQGLMEILDKDWLDLYVWTLNGSSLFRVDRSPEYWSLMYGVLSDFWWANVVPGKQVILLQKNVDVKMYRPARLHSLTSILFHQSKQLATKAPLIWKHDARRNCVMVAHT